MGLVFATDEKGLKIWRNDQGQYPRYSYSISRKNGDTWENAYRDVRFKKEVSLENGTVIAINNAFESFNTGKDGKKYPYLMITDFEIIEGGDIKVPDVPEAPEGEEIVPFK